MDRPPHVILVNKVIKDMELAEYVINNFVNMNIYQMVY
jgi:hypothetical protein